MPNVINILVDVDSDTTVSTQSARLMMVDDNPGDSGKGTSTLTVNANVGDTLNWYVTSIQPGFSIGVTNILANGPAPCTPSIEGNIWTAQVDQPGNGAEYTYSFTIYGETGANLGDYSGNLTLNVT